MRAWPSARPGRRATRSCGHLTARAQREGVAEMLGLGPLCPGQIGHGPGQPQTARLAELTGPEMTTDRTITDKALERIGRTIASHNRRRGDGRQGDQWEAGYRAGLAAGQRTASSGVSPDTPAADAEERGVDNNYIS